MPFHNSIELSDPEVNVVTWADPITGYVWETVYPMEGKDARCTTACVWTQREHDAYLRPEPIWFPVESRATYPWVSYRGQRPCEADRAVLTHYSEATS